MVIAYKYFFFFLEHIRTFVCHCCFAISEEEKDSLSCHVDCWLAFEMRDAAL